MILFACTCTVLHLCPQLTSLVCDQITSVSADRLILILERCPWMKEEVSIVLRKYDGCCVFLFLLPCCLHEHPCGVHTLDVCLFLLLMCALVCNIPVFISCSDVYSQPAAMHYGHSMKQNAVLLMQANMLACAGMCSCVHVSGKKYMCTLCTVSECSFFMFHFFHSCRLGLHF